MKKTFKRIFLLVLACALSFSMLACGSKDKDKEDKKEPDKTAVDFSQYPSDFNEWKMADIQKYFEDCGVFSNSSWIMKIPADQLASMGGVSDCIAYVDSVAQTVADEIIYFDPQTTDDAVKKQAENVKTTKMLTTTQGTIPIDTMCGNFAFAYSITSDNNHKEALKKAIDDLAAHFNISPEF